VPEQKQKHEDHYFKKLDQEKTEKLKARAAQERAEREAKELKELHFHHCGKCGQAMHTQLFRGIDIEVCNGCGAVLLDNGELEHLGGSDESGVLKGLASLFSPRR